MFNYLLKLLPHEDRLYKIIFELLNCFHPGSFPSSALPESKTIHVPDLMFSFKNFFHIITAVLFISDVTEKETGS